jgi:hypothetical protein
MNTTSLQTEALHLSLISDWPQAILRRLQYIMHPKLSSQFQAAFVAFVYNRIPALDLKGLQWHRSVNSNALLNNDFP